MQIIPGPFITVPLNSILALIGIMTRRPHNPLRKKTPNELVQEYAAATY